MASRRSGDMGPVLRRGRRAGSSPLLLLLLLDSWPGAAPPPPSGEPSSAARSRSLTDSSGPSPGRHSGLCRQAWQAVHGCTPAGVSRKWRPPHTSQTAAGLRGAERPATRSCFVLPPLLLLLLGGRPEVDAAAPGARRAACASLAPAVPTASWLALVCQGSRRSWREARSEAGATGVAAAVLVLRTAGPGDAAAAGGDGRAPPLPGSACAEQLAPRPVLLGLVACRCRVSGRAGSPGRCKHACKGRHGRQRRRRQTGGRQ